MSAPTTPAKTPANPKPYCPIEWAKKNAVPYYLTVFGVLGAATAGFVVVIVLLFLVVTNFNVLGLIE